MNFGPKQTEHASSALPDLVDPRRSGVGSDVDHVDPGGDQGRQDQAVPVLGRVAEAAAAGVPAGVMQLVVHVGHRQPVDHLRTQRRFRNPQNIQTQVLVLPGSRWGTLGQRPR